MYIIALMIVILHFAILSSANNNDQKKGDNELLNKCEQQPNQNDLKYCSEQSQAFLEFDEKLSHQRLLDWLKIGNGYFDKIEIEYYSEDYRGVNAKQDIEANEIILIVPKTHIITLEMAKQTDIVQKLMKADAQLLSPKHTFLSIFLLQEKQKPDSFWKPYIDILPKTYSNFPIFYSNIDLEWLKGSPFFEQIIKKLQNLEKDYEKICEIAPEFRMNTFQDFCWARTSTCSRIFTITIDGNKTDSYVPLADMLNHEKSASTTWYYSNKQNGFSIEAINKIKKGQAISDSYGQKSNSRFLLNYGFTVEKNYANDVDLIIEPNFYENLFQIKEDLTKVKLRLQKTFKLSMDTEDVEVKELMSYIRFIIIKSEDLINQILIKQGQDYIEIKKINFINIQNELEMWIKIGQICKKQLKQYPTTYEQDQVILENQDLTINQRNCLILRMGEKEILRFYLIFSQKMTLLLNDFNLNQIYQFCKQEKNKNYKKYIQSVLTSLLEN